MTVPEGWREVTWLGIHCAHCPTWKPSDSPPAEGGSSGVIYVSGNIPPNQRGCLRAEEQERKPARCSICDQLATVYNVTKDWEPIK